MSEMVRYTGTLIPVEKLDNESLEMLCRRILMNEGYLLLKAPYSSWEEMLSEKFYDKYIIANDTVYEIMKKIQLDADDDIYEASANPDGTITYDVQFYNGGCSFEEAVAMVIDDIETDYCKWAENDDDTISPLNPINHKALFKASTSDDLKYCPYCGRLIKVINVNDY